MADEILNAQKDHWDDTFAKRPELFGERPSDPARKAAELLKREGKTKILELGAGQGRDSLFFAQGGFRVYALDYSEIGIKAIGQKAEALGLSGSLAILCHDVRTPLPFKDESLDGCFSHMLYCMALTMDELEFLSQEIRRVLKPGGLNIYTVRNTGDPDYGRGTHRGEDRYEMGGFIVHFFSREKVERLARGYEILAVEEFEEGRLPRRLYCVVQRKK